jgi:hypothetical protein
MAETGWVRRVERWEMADMEDMVAVVGWLLVVCYAVKGWAVVSFGTYCCGYTVVRSDYLLVVLSCVGMMKMIVCCSTFPFPLVGYQV